MRSLVTALLLLSVGGTALAQNDTNAELRREVAEMRREISDLRREIYALRLDLLSAIDQIPGRRVGGKTPVAGPEPAATPPPPALGATGAPAPALTAEAATEEPTETAAKDGRVTGTIDLGGMKGPAYVYVENVPQVMAKGATFDLKQSGRQFSPRHAVIQVGTKVNFPNLDAMYHNVFSKTPGSVFDLGIYRAGDPMRSYTMTKTGVVDIFCDMHSEMTAEVLVVPSRLYAPVGADGKFVLEKVPRGTRKIVAWAPGFEPSTQSASVGAKETTLAFKLARKSGAHTNKSGQPYGSYK